MKYILKIASVFMFIFALTWMFNYKTISILEIKVRNIDEKVYRITYSENSITSKTIRTADFKTLFGVHNFIDRVADKNYTDYK